MRTSVSSNNETTPSLIADWIPRKKQLIEPHTPAMFDPIVCGITKTPKRNSIFGGVTFVWVFQLHFDLFFFRGCTLYTSSPVLSSGVKEVFSSDEMTIVPFGQGLCFYML